MYVIVTIYTKVSGNDPVTINATFDIARGARGWKTRTRVTSVGELGSYAEISTGFIHYDTGYVRNRNTAI